MSGYRNTNINNMPGRVQQGGRDGVNTIAGVYPAVVVKNNDSTMMGRIEVRIPEFGNPTSKATRMVSLVSPMAGINNLPNVEDDYKTDSGTASSYGMWPQPPAIGTEVLVGFSSSREEGFYLGSFMSKDRNSMMGGHASTEAYDPDTGQSSFGPTLEKNPNDGQDSTTRPMDSFNDAKLKQQGLAGDLVRGHSQSTARRESPSKVFGMTTSGGHVLTMDDGAADGSGSQNIRIKTMSGAQILMDDTNDFIFVSNSGGSAYIEIDSEGNIDMYSAKNVSVHAQEDINFHSKQNINMQADQGVNIKSTGAEGIKMESSVGGIHQTAKDIWSVKGLTSNITSNHHKETASRIDMNGPTATVPTEITMQSQVANRNILESAASRVPEHHPWKGVTAVQERFKTGEGNIT